MPTEVASAQDAIRALEEVRGSKVLVHVLSDRRTTQEIPGLKTQLGGEAYPLIYKHLRKIGKTPRLDLVLHTSGGAVDSVWPLVQLCRSFVTDRFAVIIPLRALSSGTLLCLGADEIVMTDAAHLSPVDPTTQNAFNPRLPDGPQLPISVEDVSSYFQLATDSRAEGNASETSKVGFGIRSDDHVLEVFKLLAQQVHPLALGNVKRVHTQIRALARELLKSHLNGEEVEGKIQEVVRKLTQELFSHGHMINRKEAESLLGNEIVKAPSEAEDAAIWNLFEVYERLLDLYSTFSIKDWIGDELEKILEPKGAVLESLAGGRHEYISRLRVRQVSDVPKGVQIQVPVGQRMPLVPGLPTSVTVEFLSMGWKPAV